MTKIQRDKSDVSSEVMMPRILLLLSTLALLLLGFVMVYSTSSVIALSEAEVVQEASAIGDVSSQMLFAVIGIVAALAIWKFLPCDIWRGNFVWIAWGIAAAFLVATLLFGTGEAEWGANRWIIIGGMSLQGSEFAKIALILVAARIFTDFREGQLGLGQGLVMLLVMIVVPVLLIMGAQSDLGTAMICVVGILAVMWLGEVPLRIMLILIAAVIVVGLVAIFGADYRRERLMVFLDPWNDGQGGYGTGYQLIHSWYALAGGGLFGVGLGNSYEKYLYLTQSDTDFIFAIIGEELGLLGALFVIVLFLVFLYAGMRIALSSSNNIGVMIAGGLTIMIAFQAFLNIAMVIGCFPIVGKPLPFISSGGSAMIANLMMVGLILSVSQDAGGPSVYDRRRDNLRIVRTNDQDRERRSSARSRMTVVKGGR